MVVRGNLEHAARRVGALALVVAGLGLFLPVAPVRATPPGVNGRVDFMRADANGFWQVWTSNPDLTASHQLTSLPADSGWAVWSPDASRIAFDSDRTDPDLGDANLVNDIFTMRADGTAVVKITDSVGFSGDAGWSPNGQQLAFEADRGTGASAIFVASAADGSGLRRLTNPGAGEFDAAPRFSPDGTRIVFTRYRGGHTLASGRLVGDTSALFVVDVATLAVTRVTGWGIRTGDADWSPDGRTLVFEQVGWYYGPTDIMTVPAGGGPTHRVTNGVGIEGAKNGFKFEGFYDPVWSPDGSKILLGHELIDANGQYVAGLATVNPDGSSLAWTSNDPRVEHQPDWGTAPLQ